MELIAQISCGDMRTAINILNITFNKYKMITKDNVLDVYNIPHPERLKEIILSCIKGDIKRALEETRNMKCDGFCY